MNKHIEQLNQLKFRSLLITVLAALISLWGLLAVYRTQALNQTWDFFLMRQCGWMLIAWSLFFLLRRLKFEIWLKAALPLAGIGALSLLLLPFFGLKVNGMNGWYQFGSVTIQPSEIVKAFYILALIKVLNMKNIPEYLRVFSAYGIIGCFLLLIIIQPDLGTVAVYAAGGIGALYFSRVKLRYIFAPVLAAVPAALVVIMSHGYMRRRILHFLDPGLDPTGGGWHLRQFATAVARGEWVGVKGDMAVWSNSFLPLSYNDSVFAGLCEMLGFVGGIVLLMFFLAWFWQMFMLGFWRRENVRRSFIDSASFMLLAQVLLHVGVNLGLLPTTGITLVLVSYGGSSCIGTMMMLGILLAAGRKDER